MTPQQVFLVLDIGAPGWRRRVGDPYSYPTFDAYVRALDAELIKAANFLGMTVIPIPKEDQQ